MIRGALAEDAWKGRLVERIAPAPDDVIVDLGCGTGTLAIMLKQACSSARVIGIDPDEAMLAPARDKVRAAGIEVDLRRGQADRLPLGDGSATKVVSSLVFHHMQQDTKRAALREAYRVLRPGGRLILADWAKPHDLLMRLAYLPVQIADGFPNTRDNLQGLLPVLVREAGFEGVVETYRRRTALGSLAFVEATR
nr:class I SAM-dependent methyltransferase [Enterovirga sp. DB1703]